MLVFFLLFKLSQDPTVSAVDTKSATAEMNALDNTCSACQTAFSTPQLLTRHQRNSCFEASRKLAQCHAIPGKRFKLSHASFLKPQRNGWSTRESKVSRGAPSAIHGGRRDGGEGLRRRKTPQGYVFDHEKAAGQEDDTVPSNSVVDSNMDIDQQDSISPPGYTPNLLERTSSAMAMADTQGDQHLQAGVLQDHLPQALSPNVSANTGVAALGTCSAPGWLQGKANSFHLRRRYYGTAFPTHDPDANINFLGLCDSQGQVEDKNDAEGKSLDCDTDPCDDDTHVAFSRAMAAGVSQPRKL
ncbi:hypothetical protein NMY22_g17268 [Coprinellus aureogranulatus]|nr:hypothetical protein NMY22_g17268 [Coprinellus aureogranulatus]